MKTDRLYRVTLIGVILVAGWGVITLTESASTSTVIVLYSSADTYIDSARPDRNFGGNSSLRVDGSPPMLSYLRFDLGSVDVFDRAQLEVFAESPQRAGVDLYLASDGWEESSVTFATGPGPGVGPIGSSGSVSGGEWITFDVSQVARSGSVLNLMLVTDGKRQLRLASREAGDFGPRLRLEGMLESREDVTDIPGPESTPMPIATAVPTITEIPDGSAVPETTIPSIGSAGDSPNIPGRAAPERSLDGGDRHRWPAAGQRGRVQS